jgi:hypothetical protein
LRRTDVKIEKGATIALAFMISFLVAMPVGVAFAQESGGEAKGPGAGKSGSAFRDKAETGESKVTPKPDEKKAEGEESKADKPKQGEGEKKADEKKAEGDAPAESEGEKDEAEPDAVAEPVKVTLTTRHDLREQLAEPNPVPHIITGFVDEVKDSTGQMVGHIVPIATYGNQTRVVDEARGDKGTVGAVYRIYEAGTPKAVEFLGDKKFTDAGAVILKNVPHPETGKEMTMCVVIHLFVRSLDDLPWEMDAKGERTRRLKLSVGIQHRDFSPEALRLSNEEFENAKRIAEIIQN